MAQITINIPDNQLNRILDKLAARWGYDPLNDGTKAAFVRAKVIEYISEEVRKREFDENLQAYLDSYEELGLS